MYNWYQQGRTYEVREAPEHQRPGATAKARLQMRDVIVAALTAKYDTTPRGRARLPIARELCAETGERHLGHALEIGRDILKRSQDPLLVLYRGARRQRADQHRRKIEAARRTAGECVDRPVLAGLSRSNHLRRR
jgi:hypothetical protein